MTTDGKLPLSELVEVFGKEALEKQLDKRLEEERERGAVLLSAHVIWLGEEAGDSSPHISEVECPQCRRKISPLPAGMLCNCYNCRGERLPREIRATRRTIENIELKLNESKLALTGEKK